MRTVYYFTADWCPPCKKMKPIVAEIDRDVPNVRFQIIDADSEIELVSNFNIRSIPTFILFDEDNNEVNRISGAVTKEEMIGFING